MCEFCVQHGDGKKWYLQAENYVADLSGDLERRAFMVDFVSGFDRRMKRNVPMLQGAQGVPRTAAAGVCLLRATAAAPRPTSASPSPSRNASVSSISRPRSFSCRAYAGTSPERPSVATVSRYRCCRPTTCSPRRFGGSKTAPTLPPCSGSRVRRRAACCGARSPKGSCTRCGPSRRRSSPRSATAACQRAAWRCRPRSPTVTRHVEGRVPGVIDETSCVGCGACVERCPFHAVALDARDVAVADPERCYGCGICRSSCSMEAITLEDRAPAGVRRW